MNRRLKNIYIPFTLLACTLMLANCQSAHNSAATSHNKKLIDAIASEEKQPPAENIVRLSPVHFPTGSDVIFNDEISALDSNISWLEKNPRAVLVLEGHCDERGEDLYNMELGDRRARQVKTRIIQKGIASDRLIMVVSHGERRPLDPHHTPNAWRSNRRVEFIVR